MGEDDFVSDPTTTADMPTWVDDDYDDENPHIKDQDEPPDEDRFYSD